jgi:polysaccharide pyruvyl transferase WcaK-like protein
MRITILGASFKNENLGVGALAIGTSTCIAECFPDAEISLLDYARAPDVDRFTLRGKVREIRTVQLRMRPQITTNNALFALGLAMALQLVPRAVRHSVASRNAILRHLQESDMVLSIAGGDSFSDIYGFMRLFSVSLAQVLAILMDKDLVLLPQTLGPFTGGAAKGIARFITSRAAMVYSRDQESLQEMKLLLGQAANPAKMKFCYDVGFIVPQQAPAKVDLVGLTLDRDASSPLVGLNVSGLLQMGGYNRDDVFGFRDQYVELNYKVIDTMIREKGARLLLVPHTLGGSEESDSVVCEALYEELKAKYPGKIGCLLGSYNTSELKYVIGHCDFFMGARMHACIGALSLEVPAIAVAYSRKFAGVLDTLGMPRLVVDPRTMSNVEILKVICDTYERRAEVRSSLAAKMPEVKREILNLIPNIRAKGATGSRV